MPSSGTQHEPGSDVSVLKGASVLVVEDTWHVAKALKSVLEGLGMHVVGPTATIAEAKHLVAAQKPSLALVDVNLRGEMASNLIDELHGQGIAVVIISGYAVPPVAMEKVAAFVQKPFSGKELVTALVTIIRRDRSSESCGAGWVCSDLTGSFNLQRTPSEAIT